MGLDAGAETDADAGYDHPRGRYMHQIIDNGPILGERWHPLTYCSAISHHDGQHQPSRISTCQLLYGQKLAYLSMSFIL